MRVVGDGILKDCICWDADLKSHLKLSTDDDESLVTTYISAITQYIMKYVGLPLFYEDHDIYAVAQNNMIELPRTTGTIYNIKKWSDDDNDFVTVTPTYKIVNYGTHKVLISESLVNENEYMITSEVVLSTADANLIKTVAYQLIADMYENREDRPDKFASRSSRLLDTITVLI